MKKLGKILLLALLALCLLTACKKKDLSLEIYSLGESEADDVVALDTILEEGEAILASIDAPTDRAVTEGLAVAHTYHYRQMRDLRPWLRGTSSSCRRRKTASCRWTARTIS